MNQYLCFYHPSTVVFVDDKKEFLKALKLKLPCDFPAIFFDNSVKALENICKNISNYENMRSLFNLDDQLTELDIQSIENTCFGLNLNAIANLIDNPTRFNEQSVVIVDYLMPELDGLNFCRSLKEKPIKKIMLTANADYSIAVKAFNEGIIDYFLFKDSPDLISQLISTIKKMQKRYFNLLVEHNLGVILKKIIPDFYKDCLIEFYEKLIIEHNAIEFYLLDRLGSMLFIKADGDFFILAISSAQKLSELANIADDQDEKHISNLLINREKLLFFSNPNDCMLPASCWVSFLFDASFVPNSLDLFYSIINGKSSSLNRSKKIHSFDNYLSLMDLNSI